MTLIELLIVMAIMLMVTAAAIPMIVPATRNRQMRESVRLVNSYIAGARARAIETGRPVGVMFERFNGQNFSMNLSYVEVPLPYSGDTVNSRVLVSGGEITSFVSGDALWQNQIRYGDLVKLNYRGESFILTSTTTPPDTKVGRVVTTAPGGTDRWYLYSTISGGIPSNLPQSYSNSPGTPFQIFRQPVRSSAAPLQLPEGIVVDLQLSGIGLGPSGIFGNINTGTTPPTYNPVTWNPIVMFSPNGAVSSVHMSQGMLRPNSPIYFLMGRRELMHDVSKSGYDENLYDPNTTNPENQYLQNFWISIANTTGTVTTAECAANTGPANDPTNARGLARDARISGGGP